LPQNYSKILTKRTVVKLYWNKTQIKTFTKKKSANFTHPDISAAKIERKKIAQITRAKTVLNILSVFVALGIQHALRVRYIVL
jgi:hypothetical protein